MTTIARPDPRVQTFRNLLNAQKAQVALALPRHQSADHMIRVALTAMQKTPRLFECDPLSIVGCVMGAAELGLELSGPLGQAYMVPRWNSKIGMQAATLQVGYRGFHQLAFRSGQVRSFPARVVYEKDVFKVRYGSNQWLEHEPCLEAERGPIVAFYAVLNFLKGEPDFEVMSLAQIEAHRDRYCRDKNGKINEVWVSNFEEMGAKTLIRRLAKRAPLSVELVRAAVLDEYGEAGLEQELPDVPPTAEMTKLRLQMLKQNLEAADRPFPEAEGRAGEPADDGQTAAIQERFRRLGWDDAKINDFVDVHFGDAVKLTRAQAAEAIARLDALLDTNSRDEGSSME
jgi:recombination protein RecT